MHFEQKQIIHIFLLSLVVQHCSTLQKKVYAYMTHLAIVSCHICICQHLHKHGANRPCAKHHGAIPREAELFAEENKVGGSLLRHSKQEEVADLKHGAAEHACVLRKDVVFEQPFCLCYCSLQERFVRAMWWERVGYRPVETGRKQVGDNSGVSSIDEKSSGKSVNRCWKMEKVKLTGSSEIIE